MGSQLWFYDRHQEIVSIKKSDFVFGSHQRWCEILHKNVLSCVVHTISGVIRDSKKQIDLSFDLTKKKKRFKVQVSQCLVYRYK